MANEKKEIEGWRERKEKQKEIQKCNLTNITSIAVSKVGQCDGKGFDFILQLLLISQKKNVYTILGPKRKD